MAIRFSFFVCSILFIGCQSRPRSLSEVSDATPAAHGFPLNVPDSPPIPVYHWGQRDLPSLDKISKAVAEAMAEGARINDGDLNTAPPQLGGGYYVAGDPFSSLVYGNVLTVTFLRPASKIWDLRCSAPATNEYQSDPEIVSIVRSHEEAYDLLLHYWLSDEKGTAAAIVARSDPSGPRTQTPLSVEPGSAFTLKRIDQIKGNLSWKEAANEIPPGAVFDPSFGDFSNLSEFHQMLVRGRGYFQVLALMWELDGDKISDELLRFAAVEEIKSRMDNPENVDFEPLIYNFEPDSASLKDLIAALKKLNYISPSDATAVRSVDDLGKTLLANFNRSGGTDAVARFFEAIKKFKADYQIGPAVGEYGSAFMAKGLESRCPPEAN